MEPQSATGRPDGARNPSGPPARGSSSPSSVAFAGLIGTTIEWYDFYISGTASALVFAPQFFPNVSPLAGTLAALSTFAIGFVARPVGGAVTGHIGDRIGRKSMLIASLLVMGVATVGIGLLPNYASIGIAAPILLVVLRFLQGVGVGGEWGGAVLMSVEHAPRSRRTLYGSFPQMGLPAGVILSSLMFLLIESVIAKNQFEQWGWRIPFLCSAVLIIIGLILRWRLTESPVFEAVQARKQRSRLPLGHVLRHWPLNLVAGLALSIAPSIIGNILLVYTLSYATKSLHVSSTTMLWASLAASLVQGVAVPIAGILSDRFSRQRVYLAGVVILLLWAFPYFWLINTGSTGNIVLAMCGAGLIGGLLTAPQAVLVAYAFPARVRYSGASVTYGLGGIAGGAFAPVIATALLAAYGSTVPISLYLVVAGVVSAVAVALVVSNIAADDEPAQNAVAAG